MGGDRYPLLREGHLVKALVKTQPGPGLSLEDVPEPAVGDDDVLIRVLRTGICGTDLHIYRWDAWAERNIRVPLVVGHEFVGEIVQLGPGVRDLELGDLVSGEGHLVCGRCRNCMAGRRVQCARTDSVGVSHPGAFAELISLPATNVWRHRPGVDLDVAAVFDPFGNAVHAALSFSVLGEDVLITGAGFQLNQLSTHRFGVVNVQWPPGKGAFGNVNCKDCCHERNGKQFFHSFSITF